MPPMRTYAILDAAKMPYLLTRFIKSSGLPSQSLFQGETAEELKEHSPYLVELKDDNDFTERLLTGPKGVNGLWEKELGIYIRSRSEFTEVRKHFRRFTRIQDNKGAWYYLKFWEKNVIFSIINQKSNREVIHRFFFIEGSNSSIQILTPRCALKVTWNNKRSLEKIEKISITSFVGLILPHLRELKTKDDIENIVSNIIQNSENPDIYEKLNTSAKFLVASGFKEKSQISELLKIEKASNFTFLRDPEISSLIKSGTPDFKIFVEITNIALNRGIEKCLKPK